MENGADAAGGGIIEINNNTAATTKLTWTLFKAVCFSSLGGILFGYDLGVISGALPQISVSFDLSESQKESVVSFLYLGGLFGAALGGFVCDKYGRKVAILFTDVVFAIGALLLSTSQSYLSVLCGRFVVGFAVAVSGCADVSYLSEISPVQWRGSIVSRNEACITFGFLVAYAAGYGFTLLDPYNGWRYMFGVSAIAAAAQFFVMLSMPESPVWLAGPNNNRIEEAKASLMRIYEFSSVEEVNDYYNMEFQYIVSSEIISYQQDKQEETLSNHHMWQQLFRQSSIAIFLSVVQQFCGHTNVLNFAPIIFSNAGVGQKSSLAYTILLGIVKFVVTIIVIWKIEIFGRRFLLLVGMGLIEISLICMTIAFAHNGGLTSTSLAIFGAIGMAAGYAASFGPLTWLIISEMFPSSARGRALGASTILNNICAALVSYTFLSASSRFGAAVPFAGYSIITLFAILFSIVAVPETSFKSPTDIHADIQNMCFWRFLDRSHTPISRANNTSVNQNSKQQFDLRSTLL